jgi:hypothetical protein
VLSCCRLFFLFRFAFSWTIPASSCCEDSTQPLIRVRDLRALPLCFPLRVDMCQASKKVALSAAEQQNHVATGGHDDSMFAQTATVDARAVPSEEPRQATHVVETKSGGGVAHGDGGAHTPLDGWPPDGPIPVWVWMDYKELPGFIELNLRILQHNAPSPQFQIHYVRARARARVLVLAQMCSCVVGCEHIWSYGTTSRA